MEFIIIIIIINGDLFKEFNSNDLTNGMFKNL